MTPEYFIKERSVLALIARKVLNTDSVAVVINKTIYLSGVQKSKFQEDAKWLKHELCHINQYRQYGFFRFLFLYVVESFKHGYYNNRFEVEAREAEK